MAAALADIACPPISGPNKRAKHLALVHMPLPLQVLEPHDEAERLLSLQMALKCSDLGHAAESLDVHLLWVRCGRGWLCWV